MLAYDLVKKMIIDTYVEKNCYLGNCHILPGVRIGDYEVVGSANVVSKDILSHSVVVCNPARIIKQGAC